MFGLEQMVKQMLADNGIDIAEVQKAAVDGYKQVMAFVDHTTKSQAEVTAILKIVLDMQRVNAAKLDAITSHLNISIDDAKSDGQNRIEFKQQ